MSEPVYALGYVTMSFPLLSETFVIEELRTVRAEGVPACVFSLRRSRDPFCQPQAAALLPHWTYLPFVWSLPLWLAVARCCWRQPVQVAALLARILYDCWRHPGVLLRTLAIFPKSLLLADLVRSHRLHHLHAHFANYPATAAWIAGELTGVGFSFTAHAHDLFVDQSLLAHKLHRATAVFAISDYNRRFLQELGGPDCCPIHVVHMGANLARFHPRCPAPQPQAAGPLRVLAVARLDPMKGLAYLVRACHLLHQQGLPVECVIVGEGEERLALTSLVRSLGMEGSVKLTGWADSTRVAELLQWADVFALPCLQTASGKQDGIPVALMEAMAAGVPVISTPVSGIPELVRPGCGLLVPPAQVVALAQALEQMTDPGVRARLAAAGRRLVMRDFDAAANARIVAGHLCRMAGLPHPVRPPTRAAAPSTPPDHVLVLMYHRVATDSSSGEGSLADPVYTITADTFAAHLEYLQEAGYQTITPQELWAWRMGLGSLPARAIMLTFDDGDPSHVQVVAPLLEARGMTGAFFIIAGNVGSAAALSWDDLRRLRKHGHTVGSHGLTHLPLAALGRELAEHELSLSRDLLAEGLGEPVLFASAPHGSCSPRVARLARRLGYLGLFGSAFGCNGCHTSPFAWRRVAVRASTSCLQLHRICSHQWWPWQAQRLYGLGRSALRRAFGERAYRTVRARMLGAMESSR